MVVELVTAVCTVAVAVSILEETESNDMEVKEDEGVGAGDCKLST